MMRAPLPPLPRPRAAPEAFAPADRARAGSRVLRLVLALAWGAAQFPSASAAPREIARVDSAKAALVVTEVATGLVHPWGLAYLPDGRMLVTERPGRLRLVAVDGTVSVPLRGLPPVRADGQGGLLDVAIGPAFMRDRTVFLSFTEPAEGGAARTAVARAVLDGDALRDATVIFRQQPATSGPNHFGGRLVVARDGSLFVTLGDRYAHRDRAQDLSSHLGKVVRVRPDGSAPSDNPFVGRPGALAEIWSLGHRNVQGAALHPSTGRLWTHEHGPQGGDEVNVTLGGSNYGWPVITFGREYVTGFRIGEGTAKPGMEQPLWHWVPSIAPSGMVFYSSTRIPGWTGSLLLGALRGQALVRLELDGERVVAEERLLQDLGERIRDVRVAPDGGVHLLTDSPNGRILRLAPR